MPSLEAGPARRTSLWKRVVLTFVAAYALIVPVGLGLYYWLEQTTLHEWSKKHDRWVALPVVHRVPEYFEGIKTPATVPASETSLKDDEMVIGVEAGGKSRAYRLNAMIRFTDHIVNDIIGEQAVSVTYCNMAKCVRAFGGSEYRKPLDIAQGGLLDERMVLRVGRSGYMQETSERIETDQGFEPVPFPYSEYPSEVTTWGQWKAQHPDTDVYEGVPSDQ